MGLFEVFLLSVGLAMDAFAVSICKGLAVKKITAKEYLLCGIWFGSFQGIMPFIGYLVGSRFEKFISSFCDRFCDRYADDLCLIRKDN